MSAEAMNCPACGAPLELKGTEEIVVCAYCRSTISVHRRSVNSDGSVEITDKATGLAIGSVHVPLGYSASGSLQPDVSSYTYPFGVSAGASDGKDADISYFIGEGFCDRSKCPLLSGIYSQGLEQISKAHYKNFQDVGQYAHAYACAYASSAGASALSFAEERPMPLYEPFDEGAALESYRQFLAFEKQRSGNADMAKDLGYYLKGICRIYDMTVGQCSYKLAIVTVVKAWKYQLLGGLRSLSGIGDKLSGVFGGSLGASVGSALSGMDGNLRKTLFGNSMIGRALEKNVRQSNPQPQQQPQQQAQHEPACAFGDMPHNSIIDWQSDGIFMLRCPAAKFEDVFFGAFTDFCSTFRLDNGIREKMFNMQNDILRAIERHTQQNIDQMNRQFQSWQQVHATQQAAFDSYNKAWWDRTNAADNARRSSYRSKMAAEDRMSGNYSEAVRGVNTYVREDGTEVEVSVAYDRAYTNNAGDVLGSNSAFEPKGSWREMNRKQ